MLQTTHELTPREHQQQAYEREMTELAYGHDRDMKRMEIELAKVEAKWNSWLRIPMELLRLPVKIVFGVAYIVAMLRKHDVSENFWKYVK